MLRPAFNAIYTIQRVLCSLFFFVVLLAVTKHSFGCCALSCCAVIIACVCFLPSSIFFPPVFLCGCYYAGGHP